MSEARSARSRTFGESVAIAGTSIDAAEEFAVRLARFPGAGFGALGVQLRLRERSFQSTVAGLDLAGIETRTAVEAEHARFEVRGGARAVFERWSRSSTLRATACGWSPLHEAEHSPMGLGAHPFGFRCSFTAGHPPVQLAAGRVEVMGRISLDVDAPWGRECLELPGKWHEQTGERPSFGPAFVYLEAQGQEIGLLAIWRATLCTGYVVEGGAVTAVEGFEVDPYGAATRAFTVDLADGRTIRGRARVLRRTSVPIEGQRRPGATVQVESTLGRMVGHLNDWQPVGVGT